jgi:branched-chain amino acid transport system ATP-binding protein
LLPAADRLDRLRRAISRTAETALTVMIYRDKMSHLCDHNNNALRAAQAPGLRDPYWPGYHPPMPDLLTIDRVSLAFGGVAALTNVSVGVADGRITAIIGPNGAGKTSLFNVTSGFYRPASGAVTFAGQDLLALPAHARPRLGIARTFQNIALFAGLSVLENIKLGAHAQLKANAATATLYLGPAAHEERHLTARINSEILPFLHLGEMRDRPVGGLPYGVQKRIELARALVMQPRLLLLDEPFAGMNAAERMQMANYIRRSVKDWRTTVVLIDHDMEMVMGLSDHVVVLNFGRVIAAGAPQDVRRHPGVVEAYLGAA